jgi:hypothetical protein
METSDHVAVLVRVALDEFETARLAAAVRSAYRIARLRGDEADAWLFATDVRPFGGSKGLRHAEVRRILGEGPDVAGRHNELLEVWMAERQLHDPSPLLLERLPKDSLQTGSIDELEERMASNRRLADEAVDNPKTQLVFQELAGQISAVLGRIRHRAFEYLCRCEAETLFSTNNAQVFERYRHLVEAELSRLDLGLLDQINAAYARSAEDNPESRSHALTSCRRVLKGVADLVYPPRAEPAVDANGREHLLGEEQFGNRLWMFFKEASGGTAAALYNATVVETGNRIDRMIDLSSKGVHAKVSAAEVDQSLIQTYCLVGEVLRLHAARPGAQPTVAE